MIDTVLFDLDGTLVDTNELIIDTVDHVFKTHLKQHQLEREDYIKFIGPTLRESFLNYAKSEAEVDFLIKAYKEKNLELHDHYVKAFEGASLLLSELKKEGYQLAIVSSKMNHMVRRGLAVTNLISFFDVIIGSDDVIKHKPDKEPILKALSFFKEVKNAIYVGDHPNDIMAAKNANIMSCGMNYSLHKEALLKSNADFYIDSLIQLKEVLQHV